MPTIDGAGHNLTKLMQNGASHVKFQGMCTIDGCAAKPIAKGLCSKHYMRVRRGGDASKKRKPGPNPDKWRADSRKTLGEMSDRTFARYEPATRMLREANIDFKPFFEAATRPNGSFNVSRLYCLAVFAVIAKEKAIKDARRQAVKG